MNLPITVTQDDLLEILLNVAPSRPVFIWGAPGIGKSALVSRMFHVQMRADARQWIKWAQKNNLHPWVICFPSRRKQRNPFLHPDPGICSVMHYANTEPESRTSPEICSHLNGKNTIACVTKNGDIFANISFGLDASEWAYVFAHHLQKWRSKRIRCHLFLCDHTFHEKGSQ